MLYSHKELKRVSRGFMLIELLVVVLIIGILAALALPQYQFVVMKARASEAFVLGKAAYTAQEYYELINGEWANDPGTLDISFPSASFNNNGGQANIVMENFDISMRPGTKEIYVRSRYGTKKQSLDYEIFFKQGFTKCHAWNRTDSVEKSKKLCIALGGKNPKVYGSGSWSYVEFDL
jgi:prepilin-type N-terminal cleavage/methylation domain-containing protein